MSEIDFKKIKIKLYDNNYDYSQFSCKIPDLNDFLKEDANKQKEAMLNVTYLALYDEKIIGYFTLSTDNIKISNLQGDYEKKFKDKDVYYKVFPAIKIGRFGVDKRYENKGVGKFLFRVILQHVFKVSKQIGFRFITIDHMYLHMIFTKKCDVKMHLKKKKWKINLKSLRN